MIKLLEPIRGVNLIKYLNNIMIQSPFLTHWMPILADIFVFTYPVYLLALYGYGFFTKKIEYKKSAMYIFTGVASSTIINILIQYLVDKQRPNLVLGLSDLKHETILHKFLPSSSFPSDHAVVSMSIAVSTIIRGIMHHDRKYIRFGIILIAFSLIMSIARITTAVHRPTDIIGGILLGILIPLILTNKKIYNLLDKIFTWISKII